MLVSKNSFDLTTSFNSCSSDSEVVSAIYYYH